MAHVMRASCPVTKLNNTTGYNMYPKQRGERVHLTFLATQMEDEDE